MKHLKLFENKILDNILDKISTSGESSLTAWEKKYLDSYGDYHKRNQMEQELTATKESKPLPTEYKEKEIESTIENDQVAELWELVDDNELNEFLDSYHIEGNYGTTRWDNLPKEIKIAFTLFLKQKGHIK